MRSEDLEHCSFGNTSDTFLFTTFIKSNYLFIIFLIINSGNSGFLFYILYFSFVKRLGQLMDVSAIEMNN